MKSEPIAQTSIFTFHDSIELFLQLAAEKLQVSDKIHELMEYWEKLKPKLKGEELAQKRAIERLNKARVDFKHHGILPSKSTVEEFRVATASFFKDNTPLIFGVQFEKISLTGLILNQATKEELEKALKFMEQGKIGSALLRIKDAFGKVLQGFRADSDSMYGPSPFYFGESMEGISSRELDITHEKLADFVDRTSSAISYLQRAMKLVSLGIDFRKYQRFSAYAHNVSLDSLGQDIDETEYSVEDCQFCFDFVIETALHMQEADFEYDWLAHHYRHKGE